MKSYNNFYDNYEFYYQLCIGSEVTKIFSDALTGVVYWKEHRHQKCYRCKQKGHLMKDCHKICNLCNNIHSTPFCLHYTTSLFQDILKELRKKRESPDKKFQQVNNIIKNLEAKVFNSVQLKESKDFEDAVKALRSGISPDLSIEHESSMEFIQIKIDSEDVQLKGFERELNNIENKIKINESMISSQKFERYQGLSIESCLACEFISEKYKYENTYMNWLLGRKYQFSNDEKEFNINRRKEVELENRVDKYSGYRAALKESERLRNEKIKIVKQIQSHKEKKRSSKSKSGLAELLDDIARDKKKERDYTEAVNIRVKSFEIKDINYDQNNKIKIFEDDIKFWKIDTKEKLLKYHEKMIGKVEKYKKSDVYKMCQLYEEIKEGLNLREECDRKNKLITSLEKRIEYLSNKIADKKNDLSEVYMKIRAAYDKRDGILDAARDKAERIKETAVYWRNRNHYSNAWKVSEVVIPHRNDEDGKEDHYDFNDRIEDEEWHYNDDGTDDYPAEEGGNWN